MPDEIVGKSLSVHPSALMIQFAFFLFTAALGLLLWYFHGEVWFDSAWRIIVALGVLVLGYLYLARITSVYTITPIEVSLEVGILSKKRRAAPLNRVTNFEVNRPLLKRILGLADLHIDTAGGSEIEIELTEMSYQDAKAFERFLSWHIGAQKVAEAGAASRLRESREQALEDIAKDS